MKYTGGINPLLQLLFRAIWSQRWPFWPLICPRHSQPFLPELLYMNWLDLPEMYLYGFWGSVATFCSNSKSKMVVMPSTWLRQFPPLFTACELTRLTINVPLEVLNLFLLFKSDLKSKMATIGSDWPRHFSTSFPDLLHVYLSC